MKKFFKYKNVIIVGTHYSFLISLLLFKLNESYIYLTNGVKYCPKNKIFKANIEVLNLYLKKNNIKNILKYYYNFFCYLIKIKKYKKSEFYVNSYLREIWILDKYNLLEDGTADYKLSNYFILNSNFSFKKKLKNILRLDFRKNILDKTKKIYLTGLASIPEEIKHKVEIINLKDLWNKKINVEKEEILNIFGFDKNIVNSIKNRKYILYTQPLSEDEILLENEKIELYSKILKKYDENFIVLKKHPREKTDYKKIFPNIEVMDQVFPAELLTLLDIHFEKAITIFSTAALIDDKVQVDFYGTEIHPKLFKRFGSQDIVMKRNVFLSEEEIK